MLTILRVAVAQGENSSAHRTQQGSGQPGRRADGTANSAVPPLTAEHVGVTNVLMRAFKFRTAENLHFVLDILIHRRLYCAPTSMLNDIREGDVRIGQDQGREVEILDFGMGVGKRVRELRVCALSTTIDNHLLWANYAGGYSGVAIEVDIPDEDALPVEYGDNFIFLSDLKGRFSTDEAARAVLLRKYGDWSYEREVRIIGTEPYYKLARPISRVVLGSRVTPAVTAALQILCRHYGVELKRMVVADHGIYTVGSQESPLLRRSGDA